MVPLSKGAPDLQQLIPQILFEGSQLLTTAKMFAQTQVNLVPSRISKEISSKLIIKTRVLGFLIKGRVLYGCSERISESNRKNSV